ncbi:MAG TPA: hypothetical protein H9716_00150 [Candidatus Enterocloster faecavium]|uniref:Nucleic acid-binding domain protein n=1 Tax=Candidatus Enterocloster faecavium TaxID=2838560 RepID=A0A9D2L5B4_9FIRM|nr:hypothetical protein [Candidatus Enterocloster faecavium]
MKKSISMLLILSMAASLAGCAGNAQTQTSAADSSQAETEAASSESASENAAESTTAGSAGEDAEESTADVLSYQEYMDAELDTEVTIQAYVQAKQSWWEEQATVYAQDEDGAYFIYNMACPQEDYERLVPGTKIQVTGYKSEWSGEVEIMDGTFEILEGEEPYIASPLDVTDLLGTDELIEHQNQLVTFQGMTVEAAGQDDAGNDVAFLYNWDGSGTEGDDLYFNASCNGETYTFTVESNLCDSSTQVYSDVKNLQIGQTINMEGFLYWYEGVNPHITSVTVVE